MKKLSHIDESGKAMMVDVGEKPVQRRTATARGYIGMHIDTVRLVEENKIKKGDVLAVAEIAGIQAAKNTSSLIPLCHNIQISSVSVETRIIHDPGKINPRMAHPGIEVTSTVRCTGQTGVEMEALTAVSVSLLTIYDMCKAVEKHMVIENIVLLDKVKR